MKNSKLIHSEFKSLLDRFQSGNCNELELLRLEEMFLDATISEQIKNAMLDEIPEFESKDQGIDPDYDRLFKSIHQLISAKKKSRRMANLRFNGMRIAAIVLVAFLLGGSLSYFLLPKEMNPAVSFCEITAPLGSTSEIILPDNSRVWLNAGSTIRYSTSFNQHDRLLFLEGEGYFKVAKNNRLPFIVDAFGFEVKAIGTEFNVKAYRDDATIETTLVEGKVTLLHATDNIIEGVFLVPNQKAIFYKSKESLTIEVIKKIEEKEDKMNYLGEDRLVIIPKLDPRSIVSWKDDRLIIEKERLDDLVELLGRKYNFNFEFKSNDIKRFRFSGTLEDETLQQVMDVIQISSPIDYTIVGKTVIIERNDKRVPEFEKLLK